MTRTAPFSKAAIRNTVLAVLLAPLVPGAALFLIAIIAAPFTGSSSSTASKPAVKSDYDQCLEYKKQWPDAYDCDRVKNWVPVTDRVEKAKSAGLLRRCEDSFKPLLTDPGSYRYIRHTYAPKGENSVTVLVNYTATNSFGARVQGVQSCSYKL